MKALAHPLSLIVSAFVLASCAGSSPITDPAPPVELQTPPEALARAYDGYLAGDFPRMAGSLREVLTAKTVLADVRDNALTLLDAAYERGHGTVPAGWELPRGLVKLELGQVRVAMPGGGARLVHYMTGRIDAPERIQTLTVTHGGAVILDKAVGPGRFEKVKKEEDGLYSFSLDVDGVSALVPGVYEVAIALADAPPVNGWVILTDTVEGARLESAPHLTSPGFDEIVSSNPTLAFDEPFSPAYKPFERRVTWVGVSQHDSKFLWEYWTDAPTSGVIVLGKDAKGTPAPMTFAPGRYHVGVQWMEKRRFGPVDIARGARTGEPFRVE